MAEIVDKAALGTLADDDKLAIVQNGTTWRIDASNLKKRLSSLDIQPLALGGSGADLSVTGGTSEYVKQSQSGAVFTVGTIGNADIVNATEAAVGFVELATQTEVDNGTATTKVITPVTLQDLIKNLAIVGEIARWTTGSMPSGWLKCDGSAISRTTYSELFDLIGTTFGVGDGATTFNIPNYIDRMPLGVSGSFALASTGGTNTHQLTTSEIPSHTHSFITTTGSTNTGGSGDFAASGVTSVTSGSAGSDTAHNNLHPYLALHYIIFTGV